MATLPSPLWPLLARIEAPDGAQAAASQRLAPRTLEYPLGFRAPLYARPHSVPAPAKDAAPWFREVHAGWMSAQFVHFCATCADFLHLHMSETLELVASARFPDAQYGVDGSLAPRKIAVWVQLSDLNAQHAMGERVLDALAHWAAGPGGVADKIRLSVVSGTQGHELTRRNAQESTQRMGALSSSTWAVRVTVRWVSAECTTHAETVELEEMPATADVALADVQQVIVRVCGTCDVRFPLALTRPVATAVPPGAFATNLKAVSEAFSAKLESANSVTLGAAAKHASAAPLENTGVVVRLVQRALGEQGVTDRSAFHGVLLSFGAAKEHAVSFAREGGDSDTGLNCPLGMSEEAMGLHVCAVQAQTFPLGVGVSLFGPAGRAGEPIHAPGSFVWVESAAIRPVDDRLLGDWKLMPCDKASILPGNDALGDAYRKHWSRASKLFTSLTDRKPDLNTQRSASSGSELDKLESWGVAPSLGDAQLCNEERFMLAAFQLDLNSRRTTVGDAYAFLFEAGAPKAVRDTITNAIGQLGIRASLADMFKLCSHTILAHGKSAADVIYENERLKRIAAVSLAALGSTRGVDPPAKRSKPIPIDSNERIKRMIGALGLKRGEHVMLKRGVDAGSTKASAVVVAALRSGGRALDSIDAVLAPLKTLVTDAELSQHDWDGAVGDTIGQVVWMTLLGNASVEVLVFVLTARVGAGEVSVQRVACHPPRVTDASLDEMCGAKEPCVLLVQHTDTDKVRLTATVPIAA